MTEVYEDQPTDRFPKMDKQSDDNGGNQEVNEIQDWLAQGTTCLENAQYEEAIEHLEKILRVDPDHMVAYEKLSIAKSILADIDSIEEYMAIGRECMNTNDWKGAIAEFQAVLAIKPDHEEAHDLLDQATENLGEVEKDDESMKKPVSEERRDDFHKVDDDFALESINGGEELSSEPEIIGESDEMKRLDTGDQMKSDDIENDLELALQRYEDGDLENAKSILDQLAEKNPGHSQIKYYLDIIDQKLTQDQSSREQEQAEEVFKEGMDALEQENYAKAIRCFEESVRLLPTFEQAKMMLERAQAMRKKKTAKTQSIQKEKKASRSIPSKSTQPIQKRVYRSKEKKKPIVLISLVMFAVIIIVGLGYFFMFEYPKVQVRNHLNKAQRFIESDNHAKAVRELNSALELNPEIFDAWESLGITQMKLNHSKEAVTAYQKALDLDPKRTYIHLKLGDALASQKKYDAAETHFQKAASDPTLAVESYYKLAQSQEKLGKLQEAIKSMHQALKINPDYAQAHLALAQLYEKTAELEQSENEYLLAIEKDSKFTEAYINFGQFYLDNEDYQAAAEILNQPLMWEKPTNSEKVQIVSKIRMLLGRAYYNLEQYEQAEDEFNKVIMLSESADAYREVGLSYYKSKKYQQAIHAWNKALEKQPNDAETHFNLGSTFLRIKELPRSEEQFRKAIEINPNHAKSYANLGIIYYRNYEYSKARDAWRRSLEIDPEQPQIKRLLEEVETQQ